jgi:hypothetical protein
MDLIGRDPGLDELIAIDRPQIQPKRSGSGPRKPTGELVVTGAGMAKGVEEFGPDFVTASANAGADGRDQIGRANAVFLRKGPDGRRYDARC